MCTRLLSKQIRWRVKYVDNASTLITRLTPHSTDYILRVYNNEFSIKYPRFDAEKKMIEQ